jgi:hypothetical protein
MVIITQKDHCCVHCKLTVRILNQVFEKNVIIFNLHYIGIRSNIPPYLCVGIQLSCWLYNLLCPSNYIFSAQKTWWAELIHPLAAYWGTLHDVIHKPISSAVRTRNGIVNMRGRQKALSSTQSPSSAFLSSSAPLLAQGFSSPLDTPQSILGHSTPVCYSSQLTRPSPICSTSPQIQDGGRLLINVNRK